MSTHCVSVEPYRLGQEGGRSSWRKQTAPIFGRRCPALASEKTKKRMTTCHHLMSSYFHTYFPTPARSQQLKLKPGQGTSSLAFTHERGKSNLYPCLKYKRFKKIAWIQFPHLHLQWKFKSLAGKFTWGNKAKYCWVMSINVLFSKVCWQCSAMFCFYTTSKLFHP